MNSCKLDKNKGGYISGMYVNYHITVSTVLQCMHILAKIFLVSMYMHNYIHTGLAIKLF